MLAFVYNILQGPGSTIDMLEIATRLGYDSCITVTKEHAKQMTAAAKDKAKLRRTVLVTLQVVGMLVATYLVVLPIVTMYITMLHSIVRGPWYIEPLVASVPACMIVCAFTFLRQTPKLTLWPRLKWAYLLGFSAAIAYVALNALDERIVPPTYPLVLHLGDSTTLVFAYARYWVLAAIVSTVLYVVSEKIRRRLSAAV
jgi:hypothetical protein